MKNIKERAENLKTLRQVKNQYSLSEGQQPRHSSWSSQHTVLKGKILGKSRDISASKKETALQEAHLSEPEVVQLLPVPAPPLIYAGRPASFTTEWKRLSTDPWVLQCVQGYHLPLLGYPLQKKPPPCTLSSEESVFVSREVHSLLMKGWFLQGGIFCPQSSLPREGRGGEETNHQSTGSQLLDISTLQDGRVEDSKGTY